MYFSEQCSRKTFPAHWKTSKLIAVALAATLGFGLSGTANASIVQYSVNGTFDEGSLAGLSYSEVFTFDDASRPGVLGGVPWTTELLSYGLDVQSQSKHWTLADWPSAHTFSQWVDTSGYLNSLSHLATPGPFGSPPAVSDFFDDGAPHSRSKHVKWYDWSIWNTIHTDSTDFDPKVTIAAIPEPSSFVLLLTGLLSGMVVLRRRRQS